VRLTAVDVQQREFRRGAFGYAMPEVEAFREEVADNLEELQAEMAQLREEARRLRDAVKRYEGLETNLRDTLMLAQRTSEEILTNARKEADLIVRNAEAEARELPQRARRERAAVEREVAQLCELRGQFEAELASMLSAYWQRLEGHMRRDTYGSVRRTAAESEAPEAASGWYGEPAAEPAYDEPAYDETGYAEPAYESPAAPQAEAAPWPTGGAEPEAPVTYAAAEPLPTAKPILPTAHIPEIRPHDPAPPAAPTVRETPPPPAGVPEWMRPGGATQGSAQAGIPPTAEE